MNELFHLTKKLMVLSFVLLSLNACSVFKKKTKESYVVNLETTEGNIKIKLYQDVPQHSANFKKLVQARFYDSLLFHRVISQFMIQGGDPESKNANANQMLGNGDVGYKVPAEFNVAKYIHKKGALAAARDGNPEKASSGCQFYIVVGKVFTDKELDNFESQKGIKYTENQRSMYKTLGGTPHLDNDYTVFGEVIEGLDVAVKISVVAKAAGDRPKKDVRILSARMVCE